MKAYAELQAENEALRQLATERGQALYEALAALSAMWNQYCPLPFTHEFMNAGEDAEDVLRRWELLRADETSIQLAGIQIDPDKPEKVLALLVYPTA
jgi:hypothetical protein